MYPPPPPRLQHRPAGVKVSGPSPLNTSRLGSEREIEVIFSPCASNWRGIGICLPPMLSVARCSLNEPLRGTSLFYFILFILLNYLTQTTTATHQVKHLTNIDISNTVSGSKNIYHTDRHLCCFGRQLEPRIYQEIDMLMSCPSPHRFFCPHQLTSRRSFSRLLPSVHILSSLELQGRCGWRPFQVHNTGTTSTASTGCERSAFRLRTRTSIKIFWLRGFAA